MSATAAGAHRARHDGGATHTARAAIETALAELRAAIPDMHGAIVASVDGLPMAHTIRDGAPASIAAMASTSAGLGKRIVIDMELGGFAESVARGEHGYFAVYAAGPTAVLAAIAPDGVNLGRVHLEARRCAAKIAGALGAP